MNFEKIFDFPIIAKGGEKTVYKNGNYVYKLIPNINASIAELEKRELYLINALDNLYYTQIMGTYSRNGIDYLIIKQQYASNVYIADYCEKMIVELQKRNFIYIDSVFNLYKFLYIKYKSKDIFKSDNIQDIIKKRSLQKMRVCFLNVKDNVIISDIKQNNITEYKGKLFLYDCSVDFLKP